MGSTPVTDRGASPAEASAVIVQAVDLAAARAAVETVGGSVTHELAIIRAVGARLSRAQATRVRSAAGVTRVHQDRQVRAASSELCRLVDPERMDLREWQRATLRLRSVRGGLAGLAEAVTARISGDGGASWIELGRITGRDTYDISSYLSDDTLVRFFATSAGGRRHAVDVAEVEVCGSPSGPRKGALAAGPTPYSSYPALIGAETLHERFDITGRGVTVAVVDTGLWSWETLDHDTEGSPRPGARYDAIRDKMDHGVDRHGHGTHVASVILDSATPQGHGETTYNGVAPDAGYVAIKAFDDEGRGSYLNVIRALDWMVAHRSRYNIRVANLAFSAPPRSFYWDDPLNQAVMAAWQAGIVVVAAAGNTGPDPMTIGVPGNVPYVVTVGAMSDAVTPGERGDDFLASFSSAGPTVEGFVKPEIVAPGGHMLGVVDRESHLPSHHPEWRSGNYFYMSGTSQAAAVVTGTAALILQHRPELSPDDVKCRLMSSARPAVRRDGQLAYSVFQQGAGMVDAQQAVLGGARDCANRGLDVHRDLAGVEHYGGRAARDANGTFYVADLDGYVWTDVRHATEGYTWNDGHDASEGYTWNDGHDASEGYTWNDSHNASEGFTWNDGHNASEGFTWNDGHNASEGFTWNDGHNASEGFTWNDGHNASEGFTWNDGHNAAEGYTWNDSHNASEGFTWNDGHNAAEGFTWNDGREATESYTWTDGYRWAEGYSWTDGRPIGRGYTWADGHAPIRGYTWSDGLTETTSISSWVPQE